MDMPALMQVVEKAGNGVLLVTLLIGVVWYLNKRDEKRSERVEGLYKEANSTAVKVAEVVVQNTEAHRETTRNHQEHTRILEKVLDRLER